MGSRAISPSLAARISRFQCAANEDTSLKSRARRVASPRRSVSPRLRDRVDSFDRPKQRINNNALAHTPTTHSTCADALPEKDLQSGLSACAALHPSNGPLCTGMPFDGPTSAPLVATISAAELGVKAPTWGALSSINRNADGSEVRGSSNELARSLMEVCYHRHLPAKTSHLLCHSVNPCQCVTNWSHLRALPGHVRSRSASGWLICLPRCLTRAAA